VRVNSVCPGIIDTLMQDLVLQRLAELRGKTVEDVARLRRAAVPLGRGATREECVALISFLLSDASNNLTGESLNQYGGMVM